MIRRDILLFPITKDRDESWLSDVIDTAKSNLVGPWYSQVKLSTTVYTAVSNLGSAVDTAVPKLSSVSDTTDSWFNSIIDTAESIL